MKSPDVGITPEGRSPAGPRGLPFLGSWLAFRRPLPFFQQLATYEGEVVRFTILGRPLYLVTSPQAVQRVLQQRHMSYPRGAGAGGFFTLFLGQDSLLVADGKTILDPDGSTWLHPRRIMQPVFHHQELAGYAQVMTTATRAMLEHWEPSAKDDPTVDVADEMMHLTLRIASQILFSSTFSDERIAQIGGDFAVVNRVIASASLPTFRALLRSLPVVSWQRNHQFWQATSELDTVLYTMIAERRATLAKTPLEATKTTPDLLSRLLAAQDEGHPGSGMNDRQVRNQVMTLFLAGHETTAQALNWTWYLLATHPEVEEKFHAELDFILNGREATVEDLQDLPYARMVLEESMRLYPPVWVFSRRAAEPDEIGGYSIPAGASVLVSPWLLHHHPAYWEHPEEFIPERFLYAHQTGQYPNGFLPFGSGPHLCLGKDFALLEAQLVLVTIAQRYQLRLRQGQQVEPEILVTLRPKGGLPMRVERRDR